MSRGRPSDERTAPPVFVMNPYYSGIGIARALHGRGVDVFGLSSERNAPGNRSRFFAGVYDVPNGRDEPDALFRRLVELKERHARTPVLFPTRDLDVVFLREYRERLSPFYRLPRSLDGSLARILDKLELAEVARDLQMHVPKTVGCESVEDLEARLGDLTFPLVVKPRYSYQWRRSGADKIVGAKKAIMVESPEELRREVGRLAGAAADMLLQEFVPGGDADIVVCCGYVDRNGELAGHFTAKKVYQYPSLFGTGCVVELADIPRIVEPSLKLLRAFGYSGLAEIEFKYDRRADRYLLIEVNPRHWDQHELGTLAGVNVSWIAYRDLIDRPVPAQTPTYDAGGSGRWVAEREALLLLLSGGPAGAGPRRMASFRRRSTVFAILDRRDPLPSVQLGLRLVREFAARAWGLLRAPGRSDSGQGSRPGAAVADMDARPTRAIGQ